MTLHVSFYMPKVHSLLQIRSQTLKQSTSEMLNDTNNATLLLQ